MNPESDAVLGVGFCPDCPDHEACAGGYPCNVVKDSATDAMRHFRAVMADVGDAAMKVAAALAAEPVKPVPTVTTRPRAMGGMDGDIVQHVSTTVAMNADRQIVEKVIDEAEVLIRDYARTYGYRVIGGVDARSRVRNDSIPEIEVVVEARLRPITDGVWGEIRAARAQDKADLAAAQRGEVDTTEFASGGMILGFDASEPSWGWSAPAGDYAVGTMSLDTSGTLYTYNGSEWIRIATGTVD